jgi:hypothetical protein
MPTGLVEQDVRDDFDRARRRANWAKMAGWLLGRPASRNRLAVLGEVTSAPGAGGPGRRLEYERVARLGPTGEAMVPISQIVGTLEQTRCFDRQFRPTSDHVRARFQRIAAEVRSGRGMDPVELYRCGGSYYVLDGRHRIAVARALGQRSIWALVTEVRLNNPAPASTGATTKDSWPARPLFWRVRASFSRAQQISQSQRGPCPSGQGVTRTGAS